MSHTVNYLNKIMRCLKKEYNFVIGSILSLVLLKVDDLSRVKGWYAIITLLTIYYCTSLKIRHVKTYECILSEFRPLTLIRIPYYGYLESRRSRSHSTVHKCTWSENRTCLTPVQPSKGSTLFTFFVISGFLKTSTCEPKTGVLRPTATVIYIMCFIIITLSESACRCVH